MRDNGCGVNDKQLLRVFEPFFTTKGARGCGLGLGLSQRIAHAYGGGIEVESAGVDQGATFRVTIPHSV